MKTPALISIVQNIKEPQKPALYFLTNPETGYWSHITYEHFAQNVMALSAALIDLGLGEQETVGIFSENRPEVVMTNFATWQARGVTVGIYSTSSQDQMKYLMDDAHIGIMLVGSQEHYNIARAIGVRQIITADPAIVLDSDDATTRRFGELLVHPVTAAVKERADKVEMDDLATLLYTSGTTGRPKGAMLTHRCFSTAMEIHVRRLPFIGADDTSLCFLPLSHVFELAWTCFCLYLGMKVYVNQDPKRVQQSLREVQPTCMCSVPRFWEKVYTVVQEKLTKMGFISKTLMTRALAVGRRRNMDYVLKGLPVPAMLEREYQLYNGRLFRKVRGVIGLNNGRMFPTAGARVNDDIVVFCHSIGINMIVGYGLSETTATVTCYPQQNFALGSVGTIMPELKMRIGENNEVQVKGATVMAGYYNLPQETAEAFTADGWFRTGDAGRIDHEGNLYLTDRIKDLFKTANGKYIAPQAIEAALGADILFEQVAVIGDCRKFVTALIVPNFNVIREFAQKNKLGHLSDAELATNPRIIEFVQGRIEALTSHLAPYEHIKRFALLTEPFSMENGELTNTLKIRRRVVADRYADLIDSLYT